MLAFQKVVQSRNTPCKKQRKCCVNPLQQTEIEKEKIINSGKAIHLSDKISIAKRIYLVQFNKTVSYDRMTANRMVDRMLTFATLLRTSFRKKIELYLGPWPNVSDMIIDNWWFITTPLIYANRLAVTHTA